MGRVAPLAEVLPLFKRAVVVDPRPPELYAKGHVPGAVNIPASTLAGPTGAVKGPQELEKALAPLGAGPVVIYDSEEWQGLMAARFAWTLDYCGFRNYVVVREFLEAWPQLPQASGAAEGTFRCTPDESVRATAEHVLSGSAVVVDFREEEEHRRWRIPGSINLPWSLFVDENGIRPAPRPELAGREVIAYCGQGYKSALGYLALSEAGHRVRLYDAGFMDWVRRGLSVQYG